ncbi:hypothetical protein MRB53_002659 [Persea americana]|uniref:Uncharacterized protein n=1 Tax=Persea americana TaxID=3435 RepID=A0ACC2MVC8_PERAE|nr:hypothetical protein MRB53_002659 [Persea americana]
MRPEEERNELSHCKCESCQMCDQMFFTELAKEASEISGCFSSRARHLCHHHVSNGLLRYMQRLRHCFTDDQQALVQEGRVLIEYITMNAIAIQKILKKYDKVHCSVNGRNFKTTMRAKCIELLQSPWLIELGAFYINSSKMDEGESREFFRSFSCDFSGTPPIMTLALADSMKLEYNLTCAVCLDTVFNPYALGCGHLFCKGCACSAASVLLFEGLKAADPKSKCPICRAGGELSCAKHRRPGWSICQFSAHGRTGLAPEKQVQGLLERETERRTSRDSEAIKTILGLSDQNHAWILLTAAAVLE